ncbi:MAG TPA: hypothetical protein VKC53_01725 [Patescibacteria group bacterium]|nr:hypothetical protein [Patescibacteria group bacterium]
MAKLITDGFAEGDDAKVVSILNKWNGGQLSDQLFTSISKMTPQLSAIIVVFRKKAGIIETLLLPRPSDDPLWPGMLNLPGKMFRAIDFKREDKNPMNGPLERIQTGELKIQLKSKPEFAEIVFQNTDRGSILALIHVGELPDDAKSEAVWVWCDVTKLSSLNNFLESETSAILTALKHYK